MTVFTAARRLLQSALAAVLIAMAAPASLLAQDELPADEPATALRVALARSLGEHALLLGDVVRSGITGSDDFDAAAAALDANSGEIIDAIGGVYGPEAGVAFAEQWNSHVAYVVDYSRALARGDEDAAALASDQLEQYVADFSGFLADAMPVLPPATVQGLIGEHVEQLEHVSSFDAADYGEAYGAMRETYGHMVQVADGLTTGIVTGFPDRFRGRAQAFSPATDLRIALDRLLGEHTYLAAFAMRAVLRDSADVAGIADAVAANSAELRATMVELYGEAAGDAFAALWDGHVAGYLDYVGGLAAGDEGRAAAALDELGEYRSDFSAYVSTANPFLPAEDLEALLGAHTDHLVRQADAYAAGDVERSYEIGREAFVHAGDLAAHMAAAIADQFPQVFPDTALEPPGETRGPSLATVIAASACAVLAAAAVVRAGRRIRIGSGAR